MSKTLVPSWSDCVIGVVVIILFCVTLLLNILALHYTYSKIRKPSNKKVPHLLVGGLSLAGLGIALFEYPPFIASRFKGEWLYDSGVCNFVAFVIVLFGNLTICMVVIMSLERLGAIVFPFFYKEYVSFRKAVFILVFLVGYSIFLASIPLFLDRIRLNISTGVCTYAVDSYNTNTKIVVAVMVTHYIASIVIMFVSNLVVVRTVSLLDRNTMSGEYESRCSERKQHSSHACMNFAKMVGVLALCYTICWTVILMRILLLYVYGWKNYYYDQVVIVLTTFDPLINHCVCLWIMRKYRDGYASSMGSLMSCFKISDDGIWATTITRLSTISRRSTYSRASTRSSSRQSSKPYFYKQVPQNVDTPNQDPSPEGEEIPPNQIFQNQESVKRVSSDAKREWSEIIRELNAEKERHDNNEPSMAPGESRVVEVHGPAVVEQRDSALKRWKEAFQKLMLMKSEQEDSTTSVGKGPYLHGHEVLTTLPEQREDLTSEQPSTAFGANKDIVVHQDDMLTRREHSSSNDLQDQEQWDSILHKLNEEKQKPPKSSDISLQSEKSNLPELLQELNDAKSEEKPELLRHGSDTVALERQADLPEIVQDTAAKDDEATSTSTPQNDIDEENSNQCISDNTPPDQTD